MTYKSQKIRKNGKNRGKMDTKEIKIAIYVLIGISMIVLVSYVYNTYTKDKYDPSSGGYGTEVVKDNGWVRS